MRVYLDNAATTPLAPEVVEAMMPYFTDNFGNPSSQHELGRTNRAAIEQSRKSIAGHLSARPGEIIFTSGGSEATNLALVSAVRDLGIRHIITTPIEHPCVRRTVEYLQKEYEISTEVLPIDGTGKVEFEALEGLITGTAAKTLVSVMHANNEIGVLNDIESIGTLCKNNNVLFHSDTVQTMAHYRFDTSAMDIDFLTGSAHKFHGPKGIGFLYCRKGLNISPIIHGGGQERGKRSGTENVYGIVGMARAMDLAYDDHDNEIAYVKGLKLYMMELLRNSFPDVVVNGTEDLEASLYTVLNVSFPADDKNPLLLFNLDMEGVYVSGGSACNSGALKASIVLEAIGADPDRISIRFSFSRYNTMEELDFALEKLRKVFNVGAAI